MLTKYLEEYIASCFFNECRVSEVKYKNRFIESYLKLVEAKDYFQFATLVCREARALFHSNSIKFIYVYNKEISLVEEQSEIKKKDEKENLDGALVVYTGSGYG